MVLTHASKKTDECSPLISFVLRGLKSCWMPDVGRWSFIYHLDGRNNPNEALPERDVFYTLNVLLGLSRLSQLPEAADYGLVEILRRSAQRLTSLKVPTYAYGMALWAAAELGQEIPGVTMDHLRRSLREGREQKSFRAQDLGLLLVGCTQQARRGGDQGLGAAAHE